jgi:hypothetical protein
MAFVGEEPLRLRSSSVRERRARSGRQPRLPENLERTGCQVDGNSRDDLLVLVPELEQTSVSVVVLPCSPGFLAGSALPDPVAVGALQSSELLQYFSRSLYRADPPFVQVSPDCLQGDRRAQCTRLLWGKRILRCGKPIRVSRQSLRAAIGWGTHPGCNQFHQQLTLFYLLAPASGLLRPWNEIAMQLIYLPLTASLRQGTTYRDARRKKK